MTVLADACALLAYLGAGGRGMSPEGMAAMADAPSVLAITVWELVHKEQLGKLPRLPTEYGQFVQHLRLSGFRTEDLTCEDAEAAARLPMHHRDPMDRLLIAAALRTRRPIVTCDAAFAAYEVKIIW